MTKRGSHIIYIALLAALLIAFSGCEKSEYYDETGEQEQTDTKNTGKGSSTDDGDKPDVNEYDEGNNDGEDVPEHSSNDTLTVEEFIQLDYNSTAFVKGYVVGDCTKSYTNANFNPPFSQPQAILLADSQGERDTDKMIAIQLKSGSKVREHMNLVDNPKWWGRQVVFSGYRDRYLGMAGIKDISSYPQYDP